MSISGARALRPAIITGCDSRSISSLTNILTTLPETIWHKSQAILELINHLDTFEPVLRCLTCLSCLTLDLAQSMCSQVDILAPSAKRHPLFAEAKCQVAVLYLGQTLAAWMKRLPVTCGHLWSPVVTCSYRDLINLLTWVNGTKNRTSFTLWSTSHRHMYIDDVWNFEKVAIVQVIN